MNGTLKEWLESRPEKVQKLAAEFPLGTVIRTPAGVDLYLLGYTENDGLVMSAIDPSKDFDGAVASKVFVHAECARPSTTTPSDEAVRGHSGDHLSE